MTRNAGLRVGLADNAIAVAAARGPGERGCRVRVLAPGDLLFREHDSVRSVHVVDEGLVMLQHVFPDGRRQIVDLVGPGELCSWEDGALHNCTAEALTPCRVTSHLLSQVEALPDLHGDLSRRLRATVLRMQNHAALLGRKTALERVASLLARLAAIWGRPVRLPSPGSGAMRVPVPLTRREMADHLGLTQETVSRSLTDLRRRGVISYGTPGEVRIEDAPALEALSGSGGAWCRL